MFLPSFPPSVPSVRPSQLGLSLFTSRSSFFVVTRRIHIFVTQYLYGPVGRCRQRVVSDSSFGSHLPARAASAAPVCSADEESPRLFPDPRRKQSAWLRGNTSTASYRVDSASEVNSAETSALWVVAVVVDRSVCLSVCRSISQLRP